MLQLQTVCDIYIYTYIYFFDILYIIMYNISFAKPFNDNHPLVHRASSCRPRNVTGLFASIFYRGSKLIYVTGPHNKGLVLRVVQEDVQQFDISQQLTWMWSKVE